MDRFLGNFCDQFASQYHQQQTSSQIVNQQQPHQQQQVVPLQCGNNGFIGLSHHNQNISKPPDSVNCRQNWPTVDSSAGSPSFFGQSSIEEHHGFAGIYRKDQGNPMGLLQTAPMQQVISARDNFGLISNQCK